MISMNKCLILALVASVLLSAAFVNAEEEAKAEDSKVSGGLGSKIMDGIKSAKDKIMSHLKPFMGQGAEKAEEAADAAKDGAEEAAKEGEEETKEEAAAEGEGEAETATEAEASGEEESKEEEATTEEPAAEETTPKAE